MQNAAAVVFGGSRGIGRAICKQLADKGYRVAVVSRSKAACVAVARELPTAASVNHVGLGCDLSKPAGVEDACREIEDALQSDVGVLVNCAGVAKDALCLRLQIPDISEQFNVNLISPMLACRYFAQGMVKRRHGCLVNVGSIVASSGNSGQGVYSASKAGLTGFTKSVAKELARFGVRANVVEPGFINTDMTSDLSASMKERISQRVPLQRFGAVDEVADAVIHLTENQYITGAVLRVDGGLSLNF